MVAKRPTAREYPRGLPLTEKRIYQPKLDPGAARRPWVGKEVTVKWMQPVFGLQGYIHDSKTNEIIGVSRLWWYGWVEEMRHHVPETDFLPITKEKK